MDWPLFLSKDDSFSKFMPSFYERKQILQKQLHKGSAVLFLTSQLPCHRKELNSEKKLEKNLIVTITII